MAVVTAFTFKPIRFFGQLARRPEKAAVSQLAEQLFSDVPKFGHAPVFFGVVGVELPAS